MRAYSSATPTDSPIRYGSRLATAHTVLDASVRYAWRWLAASTGVGNLLDVRYFTRRAVGYPGPGSLPSDARNHYLTLGVKL